jgi:hypothetical protein
VEHEQKIFVSVSSWTWTSSPITGSYFDPVATEESGVVTMMGLYSQAAPEFAGGLRASQRV